MPVEPIQDYPPDGDILTPYDIAHLATYIELLDTVGGSDVRWQDHVAKLLGIDPAREPDRARRAYDAHLARARWMTQVGYRQLAEWELRRKDSPPNG